MLPAPKGSFQKIIEFLSRGDVWSRIGLCALTTLILYVVMFGWDPPFAHRVRQAPIRDMHAHTSFEYRDVKKTAERRDRERRNFRCYYENDSLPLEQLRQGLINDLFKIKQKTFAEVQEANVWSKFFPADANDDPATAADEQSFNLFRDAISKDEKLAAVSTAVQKAFLDFEDNGLLEDLAHDVGDGNMLEIEVYAKSLKRKRELNQATRLSNWTMTDRALKLESRSAFRILNCCEPNMRRWFQLNRSPPRLSAR